MHTEEFTPAMTFGFTNHHSTTEPPLQFDYYRKKYQGDL